MEIDRGFVRIKEGLVHYRSCGERRSNGGAPLYMIHASPSSSINLVPLMSEFGKSRKVYAPDTLGFGDSAPPTQDVPNADDYADSVARVMDQLKLDKVDMYGSHTGAHIACEFAIAHPDRVRRLAFDGIGIFSPEDKKDFLENYAPEIQPDEFGRQFTWAWHFVRDQVMHFPYFRRTPDFRRPDEAMPSAEALHTVVVEVLKGLTTYHKGYRAAFRHPDRERLPLLTVPTLCAAGEDDPLKTGVDEAASLVPGSTKAILPNEKTSENLQAKAQAFSDFFDTKN